MQVNFYLQEKPSRGRKPMLQPLWPGYAHNRSPLSPLKPPGGELPIENIKEDEEK
jgi:hypothetical protein